MAEAASAHQTWTDRARVTRAFVRRYTSCIDRPGRPGPAHSRTRDKPGSLLSMLAPIQKQNCSNPFQKRFSYCDAASVGSSSEHVSTPSLNEGCGEMPDFL